MPPPNFQFQDASSTLPPYGVFMLDRGEWLQISEHYHFNLAVERAHEACEIMRTRVCIRFEDGSECIEIQERRASVRKQFLKQRCPRTVTAIRQETASQSAIVELKRFEMQLQATERLTDDFQQKTDLIPEFC